MIPRVLVVYYSETHWTERLALAICNRLEIRGLRCDHEALREPIPRHGLIGHVRSHIDAALARACPILPLTHEPENYDVVVVGSPVWNGSVSSPVRSFLCAHSGRLKNVAFFLTHKEPRVDDVFTQMESLAAKRAVAQLPVRWPELIGGEYKLELAPFVERIERVSQRSASAKLPAAPASTLFH